MWHLAPDPWGDFIEALPATAQLVAPLPQLPLMGAQMLPQPTQPFDQAGDWCKDGIILTVEHPRSVGVIIIGNGVT